MKRMLHVLRIVVGTVVLSLSSCMDADPFGLSKRRVVGAYKLEQFEGGLYYLHRDGHDGFGGGCLDGVVLEIGWNAEVLAAKRDANFGGDPDGWMIIDLNTNEMTGPISDAEFKERYSQLDTLAPEDAWAKL